jgi:hypothetical protein
LGSILLGFACELRAGGADGIGFGMLFLMLRITIIGVSAFREDTVVRAAYEGKITMGIGPVISWDSCTSAFSTCSFSL